MDFILYHGSCPDGWCAAYICKKKYPEAELVPLNHGLSSEQLTDLFNKVSDSYVIMVDYSLRTRELNDQLNSVAKSFRILDHHKTAQAVLEGAEYATFDMNRSGAGLAWDYLFGKDSPSHSLSMPLLHKDRPWIVDFIEDRDLWNWKLPNSREVCAYLNTLPTTLEAWGGLDWTITLDGDALYLDKNNKISPTRAAELGVGALAYIEYYTRSVIAEAQEGIWQIKVGKMESEDGEVIVPIYRDYRTAVLNIPYVGVSEAGNALVKDGSFDIALLWFERGDGQIQFSLRSNREGSNVDVSAIAKLYGGGGHANASGFQLSIQEGRNLVDEILGREKSPAITGLFGKKVLL